MLSPDTRRGNLLIAAFLLVVSVVFEQFFIAPFFPMVDAAGSFRPMIVFLDIPLSLPDISWLPVTVLFCVFYAVVIGPRLSHMEPKIPVGKRVWKALTGWYLLLGCIATGGTLYYFAEDYLPKQIAKGIDSFGINTDVTLPYPSGDVIHLHGGVIQLLFAVLGLHLMARRTALPPSSTAVAEAQAIINTRPTPRRLPTTTIIKTKRREPAKVAEPAPLAEPARIAEPEAVSRRPVRPAEPAVKTSGPAFPGEPPTCRLTTPPPIAIVMPRAAPTVGKAHPCFVIGGLKPTPPITKKQA